MRCGDVELKISRIVDGRAGPGDARVVAVHLESCERCRRFAAVVDRSHRVLATFPKIDPSLGLADRAFRAAVSAAPARESALDALLAFARPAVGLATALAAGLALAAWLAPQHTSNAEAQSDPLAQLSAVASVDAESAYQSAFGVVEEE